MKWVLDAATGRYIQVPQEDPRPGVDPAVIATLQAQQAQVQPPQPVVAPVPAPIPAPAPADAALSARIAQQAADNKRLEERLAQVEHARQEEARVREEARQAALPPDQRMAAQLQALQAQLGLVNQTLLSERQARMMGERALQLTTYRNMAIQDLQRQGVDFIPELIGGSSEQEIDASISESTRAYARMAADVQAKYGRALPTSMVGGQQIPMAVMAPQFPANPAFAQPYMAGYPGAGFPQSVNAVPPAIAPTPDMSTIKELTSEEAVRSGRYSGETRQQIHRMMRMAAPQQSAAPQPVGYMPGPGGVMQPMGTPMGPVQNMRYQGPPQQQQYPAQYQQPYPQQVPYPYPQPQYAPQQQHPQPIPGIAPMPGAYQQQYALQPQYMPQYAPPPPAGPPMVIELAGPGGAKVPVAVDPNAAREAIARTHAGQNSTFGDNRGASAALADSQAFANRAGVSPQAALAARFTPTPPIAAQ